MALDLIAHLANTLAYPGHPTVRLVLGAYLLYEMRTFLSVSSKLASGFLTEFPLQTIHFFLLYPILTFKSKEKVAVLVGLRFLVYVWMRDKDNKKTEEEALKVIDSSLSYSNPLTASVPFPISDRLETVCILIVLVALYMYREKGFRCRSMGESLWATC